jgi:large subunit ribosomal protein L21
LERETEAIDNPGARLYRLGSLRRGGFAAFFVCPRERRRPKLPTGPTAKKPAGDPRQSLDEHGTNEMFAVIRTGGKQYSVAAGDTIAVMALDGVAGDKVVFDEVLFVESDGQAKIGAPRVEGASVAGEIAEQARSPKTISFKKRRRQNSKRKRGHRQDLTLVRITAIEAGA